jgi:D-alanyl-D-alanine endopeptidase (penicillin-binding protein 7)
VDTVLNWVWQGVVVAAALFLMLRALEGVRANVRYIVCSVALLIVLTIPVLWSLSSTSDESQYAAQSSVGPIVSVPATPWTSTTAMLGLWFAWTGVQGLWVSMALIGLRRARRVCRPFPTDLEEQLRHWVSVRKEQRRARLMVSDGVGRAAVLGCGTPIIAVAPALIERLSADELDYVIIHEWAHVQRRDDIATLLHLAIHVVAGWHPAVWWIERRLHVEREVACDETAVAIAGSAKSYANCLVKLTDLPTITGVSLAAPGVMTTGKLRYRITKIVSSRQLSSPLRSYSLGTAVVVGLLTVAVGIASFELFAPVMTPQTPTKTLIAAPLEPIPARRLSMSAIPQAQKTKLKIAGAPRRLVQGVSKEASATRAISPIEASSLSPSDAPLYERPDRQIPVESPDTVAADASTAAGDAPRSGAVASSGADAPSDPRSPWSAAGDAGTAIGRGSKAAGVATAGAFTRFARRVAGSF